MKDTLNDGNEWESHFILRFPPEVAAKVRQFVERDSHQTSRNDRLGINFDNNLRTGTIQFEQDTMRFTLYDLPCIIEIMKTLDNKTVYKIADLCQMIVANAPKESKREDSEEVGESKPERYQWPDGICPPLKNVRKKRFRRIKKKKYMDVADVERELKRLLRSDLEAVSVRWEVVAAAETEETEMKQTEPTNAEATEEVASQHDDLYEYGLSLSESEDEQTNF